MKTTKTEAQPIMSMEEMQNYINENLNAVGPRIMKRFDTWTIEAQYDYLVKRVEWLKDIENIKKKNSLPNLVVNLLMKKKATTDDVNEVIKACQEFIVTIKKNEIEKIDKEIERLIALKKEMA